MSFKKITTKYIVTKEGVQLVKVASAEINKKSEKNRDYFKGNNKEKKIKKTPGTHFISLPIFNQNVIDKVKTLQNQLKDQKYSDIHPYFFNKPNSLHLTIQLLSLINEEQKQIAINTLKSLKSKIDEIINNEPIKLNLTGLNVFPGIELDKSRVLFAEVNKNENYNTSIKKLNMIIDYIQSEFAKTNLIVKDNRPLKLHVTILKHKSIKEEFKSYYKLSKRFDASEIINKYGKIEFGDFLLTQLQICKLGSFEEDGRYTKIGSIDL